MIWQTFTFLDELKRELLKHPDFIAFSDTIQADLATHSEYTITRDLVLQKGKIWLPKGLNFIQTLLTEFHTTHTGGGGHMGIRKTLARLEDNFIWSDIRNDVCRFISSYIDYQHTKYEAQKPVGLLCCLPVSARPWEDLSLDFIIGLPTYQGHITILVVVDKFSKGIHLGMLPTYHIAQSVALLFMEITGKYHDKPRSLVSDWDPLFLNKFWQ